MEPTTAPVARQANTLTKKGDNAELLIHKAQKLLKQYESAKRAKDSQDLEDADSLRSKLSVIFAFFIKQIEAHPLTWEGKNAALFERKFNVKLRRSSPKLPKELL